MRLAFTLVLLACSLAACGDEVRYVEATPAPEVSVGPLEGDYR